MRATEITPANVLDYKSAEAVIIGDEKELYADRGYAPSRKMIEEKYPQIADKIMYKRQRSKKGSEYTPLDVFREHHNQKFTRLRYRGLDSVYTS